MPWGRAPRHTCVSCWWRGAASAHVVEVDDEDQGLARGDGAARAPVAVGELRRDGELAAAAHLHALDALVPAGDDHPDAEPEVERSAAVPRRVELLAGGVRDTDVVRAHGVARLGLPAVAVDDVL